MPKFFVSHQQINNDTIVMNGDDVVHVSKVLRKDLGDELTICDGQGTDYTAKICSINKDEIHLSIINKKWCEAEPKLQIVLYQALPKQGKMEYIIQKNTELGISKIVPVYTKRCVAKPSDKLTRWQKVAIEAAKQCGRGIIPQVTQTISFDEAVMQMSKMENAIMLYEAENNTKLKQLISDKHITQIAIFVGPEGGFEPCEVELAHKNNIKTVTLGKRILRTETAGAATVPIIMYEQNEI